MISLKKIAKIIEKVADMLDDDKDNVLTMDKVIKSANQREQEYLDQNKIFGVHSVEKVPVYAIDDITNNNFLTLLHAMECTALNRYNQPEQNNEYYQFWLLKLNTIKEVIQFYEGHFKVTDGKEDDEDYD